MAYAKANFTVVAKQVRVYIDRTLSPEAQSARFASIARHERDALIDSGEASPDYLTAVDGRQGASEDSVRPTGTIIYTFNTLGKAAQFALTTAIRLSPVRSGRFQNSWKVVVDGFEWTGPIKEIPMTSKVWITNTQPYSRKIDVGHMRMDVDHHIADNVRRLTQVNFQNTQCGTIYVHLPASIGNYELQGRFRKGFRKAARGGLYKDVAKGELMTYPTVEIFTRSVI
jgi:hypothetical protein